MRGREKEQVFLFRQTATGQRSAGSESGTKMTAIDCAPVNCLSLQAGGRTGCQCSAATQLEPGLERYSALVVLGVLGGGGESPATLRLAVSRCVSACNWLGSGRKVGRRRCRRSVASVRSTAGAGPQHPHFHGLHGQFRVAAKH